MAARKKELSFEESMDRLKAIVEALESGRLPLKDTFEAYEEGQTLVKRMEALLAEGEKRILLLKENGTSSDITEQIAEAKEGLQ